MLILAPDVTSLDCLDCYTRHRLNFWVEQVRFCSNPSKSNNTNSQRIFDNVQVSLTHKTGYLRVQFDQSSVGAKNEIACALRTH